MGELERAITAAPREDVGVNLLPPETPHAIPRGSVGAAGTNANPLASYSPESVDRVRGMMTENGLDNPNRLDQALADVSSHHFLGELAPGLESELGGIRAADKGEAHNLITQSVLERQSEAPQRIGAALDRAFGPAQNRAELRQALEAERSKEAAPLWRQFTQTQVSPTPEIRALMPRLDAAGALKAANKAMREEGLPAQQGFVRVVTDEAGEWANEIEHVPSASAFQYAKEHLDGLIERSLAEPGGAKSARRYTQLKNDLVRAIDNHPDPAVAGVWQAARRAWQEPTELLDAQRLGARLMTNIHRQDLPALTEGFSPERVEHLKIGLRGYFEDLEKGNRSPARVSNRLLDAVLSPGNQEKLEAVLGNERADALIEAVRHEDTLHGAPRRIVGGSPTAERQASRDRWLPQQGALDNLTLGQVAHAAQHPGRAVAGAGMKWWVKNRIKKEAVELQKLRDEVSRILTTQGPERDAMARAIVGTPEPAAGGWSMPPRTPPRAPTAASAAASARPSGGSPGGWRPVSAEQIAAARARPAAAPEPVMASAAPCRISTAKAIQERDNQARS